MDKELYGEKGDSLLQDKNPEVSGSTSPTTAIPTTKSCSIVDDRKLESQSVLDLKWIEIPDTFQSSCLDLLKCHNCQKMMYPPIYSCRKNGHAFCRSCLQGRSKCCRICKSGFSKTRNHYLEAMASLLRLPCSYGLCEDMIPGHEIDLHKTKCQYRPIQCHETEMKKCKGQLINFEDYGTHLQEIHHCQLDQLKSTDFTCLSFYFNNLMVDVEKFPPRILTCDSKLFIFRIGKYSGTEICFSISFLGGEVEAQKYRCVIQLQKPKGFTSLQWECPIYSLHNQLSTIHGKGDLLVLSENMGQPFCSLTETPILPGGGKFQTQQLTLGIRIGFCQN